MCCFISWHFGRVFYTREQFYCKLLLLLLLLLLIIIITIIIVITFAITITITITITLTFTITLTVVVIVIVINDQVCLFEGDKVREKKDKCTGEWLRDREGLDWHDNFVTKCFNDCFMPSRYWDFFFLPKIFLCTYVCNWTRPRNLL